MDAELGAQSVFRNLSFLRLFPSLYSDGGSRSRLQVEIRSGIILLIAEAGQIPSQDWGIFYVIMSSDSWTYERPNFWLLPAHTCLHINLMRENLLKCCACWKHPRLADKVWGWEVKACSPRFWTQARNSTEGVLCFLLETIPLWEILCGYPFLWLFWNSWIWVMSFQFRMTCCAWSSTAKYQNKFWMC